eukprot:gene9313-6552_t
MIDPPLRPVVRSAQVVALAPCHRCTFVFFFLSLYLLFIVKEKCEALELIFHLNGPTEERWSVCPERKGKEQRGERERGATGIKGCQFTFFFSRINILHSSSKLVLYIYRMSRNDGVLNANNSMSIESFAVNSEDESMAFANERYANAHLNKEEAQALAYFDDHHVFENLDQIMQKVLKDRPEKPEKYILDMLRAWDSKEAGTDYAAVLVRKKSGHASSASTPTTTGNGANLLFNPQFQVLEKEESKRKKEEEDALEMERQRALEHYEMKREEGQTEKSAINEETQRLKRLLDQFEKKPDRVTTQVLENTMECGNNGAPLLAVSLLRYVVALGLCNDDSQLSKNALKFYRHHMSNPSVIPLNHTVRLSYEGPLHIGEVHSYHHRLTPHLFPLQAPSVCYQAAHKLFLEYAIIQGGLMASRNLPFLDTYMSCEQCLDTKSKGMHVVFQFRLLMRLGHLWLTVFSEPVKEWPRLLQSAIYSLIGYEGVYLQSTLINDFGKLFEKTALLELQNSVRTEKLIATPCQLALQLSIRWIVRETAAILDHLHDRDESLLDEGRLEKTTVKKFLEDSLIGMPVRPPCDAQVAAVGKTSSEARSTSSQSAGQRSSTRRNSIDGLRNSSTLTMDTSGVVLDFKSIDETALKTQLFTCRGCLLQLTFRHEILKLYNKFNGVPFSQVSEEMDILSISERDDIAITLALALRIIEERQYTLRGGRGGGSKRGATDAVPHNDIIDHMTNVSQLTPGQMDNLYVRSKLILGFVDGVLRLHYRSTTRLLSSGVLHSDFSCPSFPPILMKCMVPQPQRPTLLEVMLQRYKFCTVETLTGFLETMTKVMMGLGGMQRSIFEASITGIIFSFYVELVQVMSRYLRETETVSVLLLFCRWNRLLRQSIMSVISLCIYHRMQSFSESIKNQSKEPNVNLLAPTASAGGSIERLHQTMSSVGAKLPPVMNVAEMGSGQHISGGNASNSGSIDGHHVMATSGATNQTSEDVQVSFADAIVERELFGILRRRIDENSDTGIFLDSIMNPITRERLTGQESCFMIRHWDYVKLGVQFRNTNLWFNEFINKVTIMVQHDISPEEIAKMATVPLLFAQETVEGLEKRQHEQQAEKEKEKLHRRAQQQASTTVGPSGFSGAGSSSGSGGNHAAHSTGRKDVSSVEFIGAGDVPNSSHSKGNATSHTNQSTGNVEEKKKKGLSQQEVFDMVVCSYASFSHLLGSFLFEIHTSECSQFIFVETAARWNALLEEDLDSILSRSLPPDVNFSSNAYEQARRGLQSTLGKMFNGDVSRETIANVLVGLFQCGVLPCRHFDFFSRVQRLIYRHLGTPNAPPYFTHLAHRLLKYPLINVERMIDASSHLSDKMLEAWEEFLRDPSSVFEATRAIVDLIPRSIVLENDVAMLREKLRVAPQKFIQMFSSRVAEKDIMAISIWFRLHTGIPQSFIEVIGITLYDVFLSSYDAPYTPYEALALIQRIDRAFRNILTSTQPRMEALERLQKVVTAAVAPHFNKAGASRRLHIKIPHNENSVALLNPDESKQNGSVSAPNSPADHHVGVEHIMSSAGEVIATNHRGSLSMSLQANDLSFSKAANSPTPKRKKGNVLQLPEPSRVTSPGEPSPPKEGDHRDSFPRHNGGFPVSSSQRHRHHHTKMRLFNRLMNDEVSLDKNAWRCHPLSVHLLYAVTHTRIFAQKYYAEATQKYLMDLCYLLRYVSVESYLRYFLQFFVRLLVVGLSPSLIRDITDRLFETLRTLDIPFDPRMPVVLSIILNVQLERSHDEVEQSELILSTVRDGLDREAYREISSRNVVMIPLTRLYVFRLMYMGLLPEEEEEEDAVHSPTSRSPLGSSRDPSNFGAPPSADSKSTEAGGDKDKDKKKDKDKDKDKEESKKSKRDKKGKNKDGDDGGTENAPVGSPPHPCSITVAQSNKVVNHVQSILKTVVDEVFHLLTRIVIRILEKADNPANMDDAITEVIESDTLCRRGLQMMQLLSAGTSRVGLEFLAMFGEYVQTEHLQQNLVGSEPIMVWSRVMAQLSQYMSDRMMQTFSISEFQEETVARFPREFGKLDLDKVFETLQLLEGSLNPSGTTDGVYLCGGVKRYYSDVCAVVYMFLQDIKMDRNNVRHLCRRLCSRLEGTSDDIVISASCILAALSPIVKGQDWRSSKYKREDGLGGSPMKSDERPTLARIIFSGAQLLIREYDNYLREAFELFLTDRPGACTMLDHALTSPHPPIAYEDGVPISIDMLMPSQITIAKQGLISTLLKCVQSIYVMDAEAATQIEQRHTVIRTAADQTESKGLVQLGTELSYYQNNFSEEVGSGTGPRRSSMQKEAHQQGPIQHNIRVLPFSLYGDMLITDALTETLYTSGLMTADVIRFVQMFDDTICVTTTSRTHHTVAHYKDHRHGSTVNGKNFTPEGELLRSVWQNLLCLVSQNLRRTISHSKISISKELGNKTVKAYMRLQSLIYIDLLRETENQSEFVEWMGAYVHKRPLFEEWLLPVVLRAACVVDEKAVINITRKMRNDSRELSRQQKEQREAAAAAANAAAEKAAVSGQMIENNEALNSSNVKLPAANRSLATEGNASKTGTGFNRSSTRRQGKEKDQPASGFQSSQQTAQRAVVTQRLPLVVVQDILLDVLHPSCQSSLICVLKTIAKNAEDGYELQRHLARAFFYQLSHQRLVHLTRRWCLADAECDVISQIWKKFRLQDRAPDHGSPRPQGMPPPSALAKELSVLLGEPLEYTEAFVIFLDRLLDTHLKSIFRWNTVAASLCAMFIYTDSPDFHRAIYFLQSRWCIAAITICNALHAWGGITSEKQYVMIVRVLRGVRLMKCVLQRMRAPSILLPYLRAVPYQRLLDLAEGDDIPHQALTAVPSTVNVAVVENSLHNLLDNFRSLLMSLRAVYERLIAGQATVQTVTVRSSDLMQLFSDWSNVHCSQGKDATRASFRGMVLLISTSLNELSAAEAQSIFEKKTEVVRSFDGPFSLRCGLGNACLADHLRMFFAFAMVSCNGLRELVLDEKLISTSHLPEYASKEIRVILPDFYEDNMQPASATRRASQPDGKEQSAEFNTGGNQPRTLSRAFIETCIVAAIGHVMDEGPITFSQTRSARLAESELRDGLLQLLEIVMEFVSAGLKRENALLNSLFATYQDRLRQRINPDVVCYEELCEIRSRGRLQLSPGIMKSCDYVITTLCRSVYGFFYNNSGQRHPNLRRIELMGTVNPAASNPFASQTVAPHRSLSTSNTGSATTPSHLNLNLNASTSALGLPGSLTSRVAPPPSLFIRAQFKMSSGMDMAAVEDAVMRWEAMVRRRRASQFPVAEIKIYCYIWIAMLFDLLQVFIETVPMYLETYRELTRRDSSAEELRLFFIFLHRLAFLGVAEEWMQEQWVESRIREWIVSTEQVHPPRENGEEDHNEMRRHNMEVASCAVYAISATIGRRVIRSERAAAMKPGVDAMERGSTPRKKAKQGGGPLDEAGDYFRMGASVTGMGSSSTGRASASGRKGASTSPSSATKTQSAAAEASARWRTFFAHSIRPAWSTTMTYLLRRISDVHHEGEQQVGQNIGMFLQHQLNAPSQADTEVLQAASVAESSLLRSAIEKKRMEDLGGPLSHNQSGPTADASDSSFTNWNGFLENSSSTVNDSAILRSPTSSSAVMDQAAGKGRRESKSKEKDRYKKVVGKDGKEGRGVGQQAAGRGTEESAHKREEEAKELADQTFDRKPRVTDGFVTLDELAAAHTPECTWTAINGIVYDITKFVMLHPGGADVMIEFCAGQDCTEKFVQQHLGHERVLRQLEAMRIGVIKERTSNEEASRCKDMQNEACPVVSLELDASPSSIIHS